MEKNPIFAWPETASHQVTKTLDAFLVTTAGPQAYLFISRSNGLELAESFASKITQQVLPNADVVNFDAANTDGIAGVRDMLRLASLMPVNGDRKVVLMQNMEQASVQMLNALLKTLEEPPSHTTFILLSTRPVLATIMSRCQVFVLPHQAFVENVSAELSDAFSLLEKNSTAGTAERMALVNVLANLDEEILPQIVERWMYKLVNDLRAAPQKFKAVRNSMETLQSLQGNFNKKMVLQNFVTNSLV